MSKKYYAVHTADVHDIFNDWTIVESIVKGVSGARYKSFSTQDEASQWLTSFSENLTSTTTDLVESDNDEPSTVAYVDGSELKDIDGYGSGVVLIHDGKIIEQLGFMGNDSKYIESKQIPGEVFATLKAIDLAVKHGFQEINIVYDQQGIGDWANGTWKPKTEIAKFYVDELKKFKGSIHINFEKVKAHSGVEYNELADVLAKNSLKRERKSIAKSTADGNLLLSNVEENELDDQIKEISNSLQKLDYQKDSKNQNTILKLQANNQKVTITRYSNGTVLLQGSPSKLRSVTIDTLLSLADNNSELLDQLNVLNGTEIKQDSLDDQLSRYIPNYRFDNATTDLVIHQIIYNLNIQDTYMDYTQLTFPAFRIIERYLHQGLHSAGLNTVGRNNANNFNFFLQPDLTKGRIQWELPESHFDKFDNNRDKIQLMGDMYDYYHRQRNRHIHWDLDDDDTEFVENLSEAHGYIKKSLELINRFYSLF